MTASPALAWTCLFPPDASYRCGDDAPPWVRELIAAHNGKERAVLVVSDRSAAELPDLSRFDGIAAINCRGFSEDLLQRAGFAHVRRFAILPGLSRPRWFIPLDSAAISDASFCLSVPSKRAARLAHWGVRKIARLGAPVWYRDRICIAQRSAPPLEDVLQPLFPDRPLRVALSSGSPPPTRNRKIALAVLDGRSGRLLAFAKLPGPSPSSRTAVEREAEALRQINRRAEIIRAPSVLWAGPVGRTLMHVTTPLAGRPVGARLTPAHYRFLQKLRTDRIKPAGQTAFVASLRARAELLEKRPDLLSVLQAVTAELEDLPVATTIVHGDFAPWNLREEAGEIAAYDWEYAEIDGLPLIDEIHHLLAVGYLLKKWSAAQAAEHLARHAASSRLGFSSSAIRLLQAAYLLDYLLRLLGEGYGDDYPRAAWCREVLARLAHAGGEMRT